jgi:hypothetical protein
MGVFFGDLHNHCGITYGYGSLENALRAASKHLDFCSVTPHAMWPDIPAKDQDNEYLITYHTDAFNKIKKNWEYVKSIVEGFSRDREFVTFHSFEMHSSEYGDHHFVSPSDALKLFYGKNPEEVIANQECPTIAIPHHIAYCPGYRGINWEKFNQAQSPVVEVYSKHGCGLSDTGCQPYYHTMGPKDSRNTAYAGLKQGKKFSFVGSSDHHAGFPGSYGDGRLAVLADEKTRQSIWKALREGRTYAVTGDKILCDFAVNGAPFGSQVFQDSNTRIVDYKVVAGDAIERIVLYRNLEPIRVVEGLFLPLITGLTHYKVRLELGWGDSNDPYQWECRIQSTKGTIESIEPCIRGKSILAPSKDRGSDDSINDLHFSIEQMDEHDVLFACETYKNPSPTQAQTSSIILEIEGTEETALEFSINHRKEHLRIADLLKGSRAGQMLGYASQSYRIHEAIPESRYFVEGSWRDQKVSDYDFYHMEVLERNGNAAFVSPVFLG